MNINLNRALNRKKHMEKRILILLELKHMMEII